MKSKTLQIGAIVIAALLAAAVLIKSQMPPERKAARTDKMECGTAQAYTIATNLVKQAIHTPDAAKFPSYNASFVSESQPGSYTVDASFVRGQERVYFMAFVSCSMGTWNVGSVVVNGVPASEGAGL